MIVIDLMGDDDIVEVTSDDEAPELTDEDLEKFKDELARRASQPQLVPVT